MLVNYIHSIMGLVVKGWEWFMNILAPMAPGNSGYVVFLGFFLALFVMHRFVDLFLNRFLYSPTGGGPGQEIHAKLRQGYKTGGGSGGKKVG